MWITNVCFIWASCTGHRDHIKTKTSANSLDKDCLSYLINNNVLLCFAYFCVCFCDLTCMEFYQKILLNPVVSAFPFNIHATRIPINFLLSVSFFDRIRVHWFWLDCQQAKICKSECKINEIIDNFAFIFFLLTTQQSPFLPFFIHCSSNTFPFLSFFAFILSHRRI